MTDTLLPCPFCGSEAASDNGFSPCESVTYAWCKNPECHLHLIGDAGLSPEEWNTRAPALPAQVQGWQWVPVNWNGLLERVRLTDDESKHHGSGATYWNNAVFLCQTTIRDALAAAPQQPVQEPVQATAELEQVQGWSLVKVNGAFKTLVRALDRADRKGYLADALIEPWEEFDYAYVYAAAPQSSDDFPGMWHESDLSGGATDCVQPSDDVVKDAGEKK